MLVVPPLLDARAVVHGAVRGPVGVVDHVGGEVLGHDLGPGLEVVPLHVVGDDLVHLADDLLGEGVGQAGAQQRGQQQTQGEGSHGARRCGAVSLLVTHLLTVTSAAPLFIPVASNK